MSSIWPAAALRVLTYRTGCKRNESSVRRSETFRRGEGFRAIRLLAFREHSPMFWIEPELEVAEVTSEVTGYMAR
jgi:hypothetical protein